MFEGLRRYGSIAAEAIRLDKARPKIDRKGAELEFLPAAVEVIETPASPAGRAVAVLIMSLFAIAILWASFGRIDTVAVAQGRIVPRGQVKLIQPLEPGVVRAIHVADGQQVSKGDVLIELDPTEAEADTAQIARERIVALAMAARLEALIAAYSGSRAEIVPPSGVPAGLLADQRRQFDSELAAWRARLARFDSDATRVAAQIQGVHAEVAKLQALIPLTAEREEALRGLLDKGITQKTVWLQAKQQLIDFEQSLIVQKERLTEAGAARDSVEKERRQFIADSKAQAFGQLQEVSEAARRAALALTKAEIRGARNRLTSPVDGTVTQLAIHTIGGVVQGGETLIVVVPKGAALEVEAWVLNKDIGFVEVSQDVEIKVESFAFTKYGLVNGKVVQMAADAENVENLGMVYKMRTTLEATTMNVAGRQVPLAPGMAVTAEVK